MPYRVSEDALQNIKIGEQDKREAILQNVASILTTRRGSAPLYRDFGLPMHFLDKPIPVARALLYAEAQEALERFEPRAVLLGVDFREDEKRPGRLVPILEVDINA